MGIPLTVGVSSNLPLHYLNLTIALVTNLGALFIVLSMVGWLRRLRAVEEFGLRPFIYGVIVAKSAVWFWSATGIAQVVLFALEIPTITLPARLLFMIAVLTHSFIIIRYRKSYRAT